MRSKGRAVTVHDVAAEAGVSIATVSRAMAGTKSVDPLLAARVLQAVERLGYEPNRFARALRQQSMRTIGVMVPDLANPFFPEVVQALGREMRDVGLSLLLGECDNDPATERTVVDTLLLYPVDGLVISVCDSVRSRAVLRRASARVPVVQVDRWALKDEHHIGVDQALGVRMLVSHLVERGCRRIAYVAGRLNMSTTLERHREFRRLTKTAGSACVHIEMAAQSEGTPDRWGYEAVGRMVVSGLDVDAIICAADHIAVGVVQALHAHGIRIPEDVAVASFDDTLLASTTSPPLTSVRQPMDEVARHAVKVIESGMLEREPEPRSILLEPAVVARASTERPLPPLS